MKCRIFFFMVVLGLDLSSTCSGWAIFEDENLIAFGEIKPLKKIPYWITFYDALDDIVKKYKPEKCCVEQIYHRFKNTVIVLAKVRGIAELVCYRNGILKIFQAQANIIRYGLLFDGGATKKEVCKFLEKQFNKKLATEGFDASDAVAVAYYGILKNFKAEKRNVRKKRNIKRRPRNSK